ncbi:hypothetical protein [Soonwooa purpurea]
MEIAHKIEKKEAKILKLQNQIEELKLQLENKKLIEAEEFAKSLFEKDFICKTDFEIYPNSIFYFDGDTLVFEIEEEEEGLKVWVNKPKIWHHIMVDFGLKNSQVEQILRTTIEQHFKLKDTILEEGCYNDDIESHFRFRAATAELKS